MTVAILCLFLTLAWLYRSAVFSVSTPAARSSKDKRPTRDIQVFLGHQNIRNTQIYTEFAASADERIRGFTGR